MPAALSPVEAESTIHSELTDPLARLLRQLRDVIASVTPQQYSQHPVGPIESSLGAHVRHCLDHIAALLAFVRGVSPILDYDRRERGTSVETNPQTAIDRIVELQEELLLLSQPVDESIPVRTVLQSGQAALEVASSIGREISFVLSHTIHHNAIIDIIVKLLGGQTPSGFGVAPSTLVYRNGR